MLNLRELSAARATRGGLLGVGRNASNSRLTVGAWWPVRSSGGRRIALQSITMKRWLMACWQVDNRQYCPDGRKAV